MPNIKPNWPTPANVTALTTTRMHGYSLQPYDSLNLAMHVDDNANHVKANRHKLLTELSMPQEPAWLQQIHSTECVIVENDTNRIADAAITRNRLTPLAIMTADCLPILLCNRAGTEVAAIHAGWRGLVNGIIENTLQKLHSDPKDIMAWIGPAICARCFFIGEEVRNQYIERYPFTASKFSIQQEKLVADLPGIAELIFNKNNIMAVYQSRACTFEQSTQFFSYRREAQTGRIATIIWFKDP